MRIFVEESGLVRRAAELLAERLSARLGRPVPVEAPSELLGAGVLLGTSAASSLQAALSTAQLSTEGLGQGYLLHALGDTLVVAAEQAFPLLAGVGAALQEFDGGGWTLTGPQHRQPALPIRPIYFATHFGNWYAHAPLADIRAYIEDLALDGYNELVTWFDFHHYRDLEDGTGDWDRLAAIDTVARELGLRVGRIAIVNESFQDQAPAELRATGRLAGTGYETDLCPSMPEARSLLLANRRAFLEKVKQTTHLDWLCLWPYDQGGCNCELCTPWPRTYLDLGAEIAELVEEILPGTELVVSAWWIGTHVDGEDDALFAELERRPSWFRTIMAGTVELRRWLEAGRKVPAQYGVLLFPEISMFDALPWGGRGANPAPAKFVQEMQELGAHIVGAMPYSEGRYEDVNKYVWARLQWDPTLSAEQLAREYATKALGPGVAEPGSALLLALEQELRDLSRASEVYEMAKALDAELPDWARQSWQWRFIAARAELDGLRTELDHDLPADQREELVAKLRTTYEELQHVLSRHDDRSLWGWIYLPFEQWMTLPFNELRLPTASGDVVAPGAVR